MPQLKKGVKAPAFRLRNQDDKEVSLGDFKGKKLLVYFYPRADTPGCTKQSCAVSEAMPQLDKAGIAAVGISPDTPDKQKKFEEKHGLRFPLLCDTDHAVAEAYGAWGTKMMYGKEHEGIIRSSFLVDEAGRIEKAWYKVKPEDTVPNVLEVAQNSD
ncbi:MAG: thioredoxin-dependent thiol peroxidase [Planctomycetota bacterium]